MHDLFLLILPARCHSEVGWLVLEVAIHLLSISSILCQLLTLYAVHHDLTCTLSVLVKGLRFQGVIVVLEISAAVYARYVSIKGFSSAIHKTKP